MIVVVVVIEIVSYWYWYWGDDGSGGSGIKVVIFLWYISFLFTSLTWTCFLLFSMRKSTCTIEGLIRDPLSWTYMRLIKCLYPVDSKVFVSSVVHTENGHACINVYEYFHTRTIHHCERNSLMGIIIGRSFNLSVCWLLWLCCVAPCDVLAWLSAPRAFLSKKKNEEEKIEREREEEDDDDKDKGKRSRKR